MTNTLTSRVIIRTRVDAVNYSSACHLIRTWAQRGESRYVCAAAVNNVMEAYDSDDFRRVMNQADLVTPDGMPLVWALKLLGVAGADRVYGPDLMRASLAVAAEHGIPIGLYGASDSTLRRLTHAIRTQHPAIDIRYVYSPPFRTLTEQEDQAVVASINDAGVRLLFIGISTPKQDYWMNAHRGRIQATMLGVGAAFDFLAGVKPQAPRWMMRHGLEWLFRLMQEPRRLWRRNLKHNPRFVFLLLLQALSAFLQHPRTETTP
jgi:N-acetylglucosaminyldiphosphoundecaprenol N-acetyl-beta-D-mannosaminyltransferase